MCKAIMLTFRFEKGFVSCANSTFFFLLKQLLESLEENSLNCAAPKYFSRSERCQGNIQGSTNPSSSPCIVMRFLASVKPIATKQNECHNTLVNYAENRAHNHVLMTPVSMLPCEATRCMKNVFALCKPHQQHGCISLSFYSLLI